MSAYTVSEKTLNLVTQETKDIIIIVRHGKPALSRKVWQDWREFRLWWQAYDAGGLAEEQNIPVELEIYAHKAGLVISSPLRRASETARRVAMRTPDKQDSDLIEAALPSPHLGRLKLQPKMWGTLARLVWYFGWSDDMESHHQARLRAQKMCDKLEDYAHTYGIIFVTGHGWFNRMLKGALMGRGWTCAFQNGDLHWSYRLYERIKESEK